MDKTLIVGIIWGIVGVILAWFTVWCTQQYLKRGEKENESIQKT